MIPKPYTLCGQCYDKDEVDRYIANLEEQHRKELREVESSWVVTSLGREESALRFAAEQFRDRLKAKDDEIDALKAKVDMLGKCGDLIRQKYLRCVARADLCDMSCRELLARSVTHVRQTWTLHDEWRYFTNYWGRNERRWRNLAERLKEIL